MISLKEVTTYNVLGWFSILLGFLLPFIFSVSHLQYYLNEPQELLLKSIGAFFCDIPFILVALLTIRDRHRGMSLHRGIIVWVGRFIPSFIVYVLLLLDVTIAASKGLRGASTAPIVLLLFPIVGVILVLITNLFIGSKS